MKLFQLKALPFLLAALAASDAMAACDFYPDHQNNVAFPSVITVPKDLPVGSVIATQRFQPPLPSGVSNCPTATAQAVVGRFAGPALPVPGYANVFATNVPGVGIQVDATLLGGTTTTYTLSSYSNTLTVPRYVHDLTRLEARFIKTADVATGTVAGGEFFRRSWDGRRIHAMAFSNAVQFVAQTATCDLSTGDVSRTITLPDVRVSDFTGNSTGAETFDLTANCSDASNVSFNFQGTPDSADGFRFANAATDAGAAGGAALWLYSRIGGITQTIPANGNAAARRRTVPVSNDRAVLPLAAAYWRTGTITKGRLTAPVTVTITYN